MLLKNINGERPNLVGVVFTLSGFSLRKPGFPGEEVRIFHAEVTLA